MYSSYRSPKDGLAPQDDAFHRLVRNGWATWSGAIPAETTDIMLTMDALAVSARSGHLAAIAPSANASRLDCTRLDPRSERHCRHAVRLRG